LAPENENWWRGCAYRRGSHQRRTTGGYGAPKGGAGGLLLGCRGALAVSERETGRSDVQPVVVDRLAFRPKEAADALGISVRTLRKWMRDERLPYLKLDGAVLIPRRTLLQWMAERVESSRESDELVGEILRDLTGAT
jgi:excisionase family DNA binding protein